MSHLTRRMPDARADSRVPKLRSSCDACTESKLRCSKHKPSCERCRGHNFQCVYSASQRGPRSRITGSSDRELSKAASSSRGGLADDIEASPGLQPWFDELKDGLALPFTPTSFNDGDEFGEGSPDHERWNVIRSELDTSAHIQRQSTRPPPCHGEEAGMPLLTGSCTVSASSTTCKCSDAVADQLLLVKRLSYDHVATVDVVLAQSKEATDLCARTLQCRQRPKDDSDMLLLASLLAAILGVLAELAQRPQPLQSQPLYVPQSPKRDGFTAPPSLLSIGAYRLDQQDMDNLKMSIAVIELRKMRVLLKDFESLVTQHRHFNSPTQGTGYHPDLLASIPHALAFKLHRTLETIMQGLF